jgi:regulatory protein
MSKITAIRAGRRQGKRANVFLDGGFAFSLEAEVAITEGLQVGQELSANQIEALARSDCFHRCLNTAANYLGYRPRSEFELRERLQRRGFDGDSVEAVLAKLKEQGLVDDMAFAQFWRDNRQSLAADIIDQVVDTVDNADSAYRAALSKARSLSRSDYQSFRRRLGEYLKRRGFGYGVINHTVERIWQEQGVGQDGILP